MRIRPVATLIVLLLLACSDPTDPADALAVALAVTPTEFRAGDTIWVEVSIRNLATRARHISQNMCVDPYVVTSSTDDVVGPPGRGCIMMILDPITLQPGAVVVHRRRWDGTTGAAAMLPPGTYFIQGRVETPYDVTLRTDRVPVEILP